MRSLRELTRAHYIRHPDTGRNPWDSVERTYGPGVARI